MSIIVRVRLASSYTEVATVPPIAHADLGSNFQIEKLWTDYHTLYRTFRNAIAHLSESEQVAILHDTAARLYRL
jgi:predicted TIM-barrel fold metal-dependent hydrolase